MLESIRTKFGEHSESDRLVTFLNPYSYLIARNHLQLFERFDRICIDGISLVHFLKVFGFGRLARQSFDMSSLAPRVFSDAEQKGLSCYLVGSTPENISGAVDKIKQRFPALNILGFRHGYFESDAEKKCVIDDILSFAPDIVVVGMGTPLQEKFLVDLWDNNWRGRGFTCGGFFHQISNRSINYYPSFFDKYNLRWLYRIIDEPKLLKRYAIIYPKFVFVFMYDFLRVFFSKKTLQL